MPRKPKRIDETLKAAITKSGLTNYAIAKLAKVSPAQIDRFMAGERDIRLSTAASIAEALGLELRV
jgi:transcriptional regulator with XRE-family HTH domain